MRLFPANSPGRTSPELVGHSQVKQIVQEHQERIDNSQRERAGHTTPPREHSPASIVRGVSTLGRKFSRRFEKFGESETARKLRMASPSRKYHWAISGENRGSQASLNSDNGDPNKKRVSRVDSFRNFFSLSTGSNLSSSTQSQTGTLRTPRAVKRRSRNGDSKRQSRSGGSLVDASTATTPSRSTGFDSRLGSTGASSLPGGLNASRNFGSELTLLNGNGGGRKASAESDLALSECQSEADLRYYCTEDEEDERSVVSDGQFHVQHHNRNRLLSAARSAGNLNNSAAARLGILPENRTINFQEAGLVYNSATGMQIKSYGLIDSISVSTDVANDPSAGPMKTSTPRKNSESGKNESGYSSDYASGTNSSSSRASPRGSLDGDCDSSEDSHHHEGKSSNGSLSEDSRASVSPPPVKVATVAEKSAKDALKLPPKKPARASKMLAQPQMRSLTDEEKSSLLLVPANSLRQESNLTSLPVDLKAQPKAEKVPGNKLVKDYKMIRLAKADRGEELGIIIAKKKLKEIQTTGFHIVHIEPQGLVDK